MSSTDLKSGLAATLTVPVEAAMLADRIGSGSVPVLATPELVRLFEQAAVAALTDSLPPGQTSVGTALDVQHLAPTPVGLTITVTATLREVAGRQLFFDLSASDPVEMIGRGTHTRFLVDAARFARKAREKLPP